MYFPRDIEPVLAKAAAQFRIVALTGARQTGKSTLLRKLFGKTHRYVNLDDPRELQLAQRDPELFFSQYAGPLIIDEIQYAPALLSYLKITVDRTNRRGQYLLTGSQQFTLMKNLRESLAGRIGLFQLYPFSMSEGPFARRDYNSRALIGSYPEPLVSRSMDREHWYGSYVTTYIERDVQAHYRLQQTTHFRDLLILLAGRTSQVLNLQSLSNDLGISTPTLKSWIKILEASQIIYLLRPYYVNLGSRVIKAPKLYFTDIGLVCYLTGIKQKEAVWRGPLAGALYENWVIQELIKHYLNQGRRAPLFYLRTSNQLEVDVIVEKTPSRLIPCEIKLNKTPHVGMIHAIERLRHLSKKTTMIEPGYLIAPIPQEIVLTRMEKAIPLPGLLKQLP